MAARGGRKASSQGQGQEAAASKEDQCRRRAAPVASQDRLLPLAGRGSGAPEVLLPNRRQPAQQQLRE
eukprot:6239139-Lingulodinium_polyedra.AAC.1